MNPLIIVPAAIVAFVILLNLGSERPLGDTWIGHLSCLLPVALFFGVAFFGMLVWAKHSLGA